MQGLVVEKERNKTRINSRTWVYNVDRGTQGEAVKVKAEKKNDIYLASKTEIPLSANIYETFSTHLV